jgi:PPM family protein phosphatase
MFETAKILEAWGPRLEDRAEVIVRGESVLVVVADGAGGRPGAAYTAETAVRMVCAGTAALRPWDLFAWCGLLRRVDDALAHDPAAGETTLVAAVVSPQGVVGVSAGDSGAWLIGPDGVQDLTGRQQRKPFLGTGAAVPVPFAVPWAGGTLLAASDGLFKYAGRDRIAGVAREGDLEQAARRLVDLVRLPSGKLQDDVAVVLCRPAAVTPPGRS